VERVHLHHHAVGVVGELGAELVPLADRRPQLVPAATEPALRRGREAELGQRLEHAVVGTGQLVAGRRLVHDDPERAAGHQARIELLERAGRGVARVLERLLAGGDAVGVDPGEVGAPHVDLAAHGEVDLAREAERQASHGAQVAGHLLAGATVAAGGAEREDPGPVDQLDRHAVDLRLDHVIDRLALEAARDPVVEGAQLGLVVGVVEREHRQVADDLGELAERGVADPAGRRPGHRPVGVLGLDVAQAAVAPVVGLVADARARLHIVEAVVLGDLGDQGEVLVLRGV